MKITWAGNRDSPGHFLSSQAVGSIFVPPKLAAYTERSSGCQLNKHNFTRHKNWRWNYKPQKFHAAGGWNSYKGKGASQGL